MFAKKRVGRVEIEREDFGVVLNATLTLLALVIGFSFLDGNFWYGGRSTINGIEGNDNQRNSRAGVAVAIPVSQHQTLKFSYSRGTYVTIGGNYRTFSAAWQYQWLDKANKRKWDEALWNQLGILREQPLPCSL